MSTGRAFNKGDRLIYLVTISVSRIGAGLLVGMMLLITCDVFFRFLFNKPVPGTFELVEMMMSAVVSLSIAYCGYRRGHVAVELFTDKLPLKTQNFINAVHYLVCVAFFTAIAFEVAWQAQVIKESETVTALLGIPIYPFIWVLSIGAALLALVYLLHVIEILRKGASQ